MIVLDASVIVEWILNKGTSSDDNLVAALPDMPAIVPAHWPVEVANALRTYVKSGHLSATSFLTIMGDIDKLAVQVQPPPNPDEIGPIAEFSVAYDLTAYDASYVQLALHEKAILVTLDRAMRRAAQRLNISLLPADTAK